MKLFPETGILYDALMYCSAYFSEEKQEFPMNSGFDELLQTSAPLPKIIVPFFRGKFSLSSPIIEYLRMKSVSSVSSISSLCELLTEDEEREELRLITLYTLFYPDIPSGTDSSHSDCSVKTAMRLDKTDYSADFKYQALLCLTYFRHAVTELCRALSEVGEAIRKIYGKYESETSAVFSEIRSGKLSKLYLASAGLDLGIFNEITVSFSILRPDLFLPVVHEKTLYLIVGCNHEDFLIRAFDEEKIDLAAFLDDIGSELKRMILEVLADNDGMTVSDISRQTGIPVTTTLRHMDALCDHYLIRVSQRKGTQIFYTLNREYLEKARIKTEKYLHSLQGGVLNGERNKR